ncbi:MAG TPA: glycoside hydrolase family 5 protein [Verrucomicrobiae bacterium]|nr:glycoside hydrolase family 5 protein [Verrucomicrobiae bacterium]
MNITRIAVISLALAVLFLATDTVVCAESKTPDAFAQNRRLGRGVNILGYDPIWRDRSRARFKEKYFRLLKDAGFKSVRINLQAFRYMNPTNGWTLKKSWWEVLDWAMKGAREQGLAVILDLHDFNTMGADPEANREKFLAFWRQISARYQNAPDSVYFEVLNEPCHKLTPALWNDYFREALAIIRQKNPTRAVIVGPAFWNSIDHLDELELPENDRHLIVTVHYYKPMAFTHQGASWTGQQDKLGVDWAGTPAELARINDDFAKAEAWAKEHNRPIFLGEFGAYDKAPMAARVRYIGSVARDAERHGWSWAYWQFDSDFILYDVKRDAWVEPILHALIPGTVKVR